MMDEDLGMKWGKMTIRNFVVFLFALAVLPQVAMAADAIDPVIAEAIAICRQIGVTDLPPVEVVDVDHFPGADVQSAAAFRLIKAGGRQIDPVIYVVRTSWEYQHSDSPFAVLFLAAILVHESQHGRDFDAGIRDKTLAEESALSAEIKFLREALLSMSAMWRTAIMQRLAARDKSLKRLVVNNSYASRKP